MAARFFFAVLGLALVVMATFYCVLLYLAYRRTYILFGIAAMMGLIALSILRVLATPEPPLLSEHTTEVAGIFINAWWTLAGLAWLTLLLRQRLQESRLHHKYLDEDE